MVKWNHLNIFLKNTFSKIKKSNKLFHISGDFNLNLLDHDTNRKVQIFLNIVYRSGTIPTTNKSTRKTTTTIDHIFTNSFTDTVFKTAIFKSNIWSFSCMSLISSSMKQTNNTANTVMYKRVFDTESIELFKQKLYETSWDDTEVSQNPDEVYKSFLKKISDLYDAYFPKKQQIKLKSKDLQSPWITNGIKKSSKWKQSLYEKFLKNRNEKSKLEYKTYKKLFESMKNRSKK